MGNACHVLLNDGTGIQLSRHVMARGSDNLHATLPGLMIGFGTHEGGQERVVDIDDMVRIGGYHVVRDNLHIAGQDDERDILLLQQFHLGLYHLGLVRVVLLDAPYVVGDAELVGYIAQVFVVGDDTRNLTGKLTSLPAGQQVVETVAHLRDEDSHAWLLVAVVQAELHLIALGVERRDVFVDLVAGNQETLQFPLNAHEEHAVKLVYVLVKVDDVTLIVSNKLRHFCNNTLLVRAMEKQNCCLFHLVSLLFTFFAGQRY